MKKSGGGGGGGGGGDLHDIKSRFGGEWGWGVHVPNVIYAPDIYIHV